MSTPHEDHGHTRSAWLMSFAGMIGSAIICWGVGVMSTMWMVLGTAVIVVGVIVGIIMHKAETYAKEQAAKTRRA